LKSTEIARVSLIVASNSVEPGWLSSKTAGYYNRHLDTIIQVQCTKA